jgi:hypothetical protein
MTNIIRQKKERKRKRIRKTGNKSNDQQNVSFFDVVLSHFKSLLILIWQALFLTGLILRDKTVPCSIILSDNEMKDFKITLDSSLRFVSNYLVESCSKNQNVNEKVVASTKYYKSYYS